MLTDNSTSLRSIPQIVPQPNGRGEVNFENVTVARGSHEPLAADMYSHEYTH